MPKKVFVSCGPIPARLDSVKFITNQFKGGLAFKTAAMLLKDGFDVTVVCWNRTTIPNNIKEFCHIETVADVVDYCECIRHHAEEHDFDAYVLSAAVANLMPSNPWPNKFPSHNYHVGETFDIQFEIAPRAIDIVKSIDPRVTLIGYKLFDGTEEELVAAARATQKESHADIIFANHPATAKEKKIAILPDGSIIPMDFDEHVLFMEQAIGELHYKTEVIDIENTESITAAKNIVSLYETTFEQYGTVAVPVFVDGYPQAFATTSRGHAGEPVIVAKVDFKKRIVYATGKATLNAPTLAIAMPLDGKHIIVHRHLNDNRFQMPKATLTHYEFPGTYSEVQAVAAALDAGETDILLPYHGSISIREIRDADWEKYNELFPIRYLGDKIEVVNAIKQAEESIGCPLYESETLEIGAGREALTKYAYDPYVNAVNAQMITWQDIVEKPDGFFELILLRNSIAYLEPSQISVLIAKTKRLIANSFAKPAVSMRRENECSCLVNNMIEHALLLEDDSLMCHVFHAYSEDDYQAMGLKTEKYGRNSVLISYCQS